MGIVIGVIWLLLPVPLLVARRERSRRVLAGLALTLCAAVFLGGAFAGWWFVRGATELTLIAPVCVYLVAGGLFRGRSTQQWLTRAHVLAAVCAVPLVFVIASEAQVPASALVPDLPDGVTVNREVESCGSGSCARELYLDTDLTPSQLTEELGLDGMECRPNGWLLDRRELCTYLDPDRSEPVLVLSLADANS